MPARLKAKPHLTVKELKQRYREADDPILRSHYQMVWTVASGHTVSQTAALLGYERQWVSRIIHRYNEKGPDALGDRRHKNPGARTILTAELKQELKQLLTQAPPSGEKWTSVQIAQWAEKKLGRPVRPQRAWEWARQLRYNFKR